MASLNPGPLTCLLFLSSSRANHTCEQSGTLLSKHHQASGVDDAEVGPQQFLVRLQLGCQSRLDLVFAPASTA
jgi:hypothetical protein